MRNNNEKPRVSLNKLGEYMVAKAGRIQMILKNSKFPPKMMYSRNNAFYSSLQDSIVNKQIDRDSILKSIKIIENREENRK